MKTYPQKLVQRILALRRKEWHVEELTPYQFRIENKLDLYPVTGRYHDLRINRRGWIPSEIL